VDLDAERDLVRRAQTEPEAFGEVFDMHYDRILAYVLKRTGDVDVSTDIAAEVFAKALKNIRWFTWRGIPLAAWLFRIAGNELRMHYRKQKYVPASLNRLMELGYDPDEASLVEERRSLEELLADSHDEKRVLEALSTLSMPEQDLIALRYFEGLKTKDIAHMLKKPEGTVRSMLSRTIEELRKIYDASTQQKTGKSIIGSEGRSGLLLQIKKL